MLIERQNFLFHVFVNIVTKRNIFGIFPLGISNRAPFLIDHN